MNPATKLPEASAENGKAVRSSAVLDGTAREAIEHAERVLDVLYTFHRHSETWKQFKATEARDKLRALLAVPSNVPALAQSGGEKTTPK